MNCHVLSQRTPQAYEIDYTVFGFPPMSPIGLEYFFIKLQNTRTMSRTIGHMTELMAKRKGNVSAVVTRHKIT